MAINSPIFKLRHDVKYDRFKNSLTRYRSVIHATHIHRPREILAPGYSSNTDAAKKCRASTKAMVYPIPDTPSSLPHFFLLHFTPSISPLERFFEHGEIFKIASSHSLPFSQGFSFTYRDIIVEKHPYPDWSEDIERA